MTFRFRLFLRTLACVALTSALFSTAHAEETKELKEILGKTPDAAQGATLFRNCVACHGADGLGVADGSVPVIAGQHSSVIAKQLLDYRHAKRWDIRMEAIANRHALKGPQDIANVAGHASNLERSAHPSIGDGTYLKNGEAQYAKQCASCHGERGEGNAKTLIPKLAGQHYGYLLRQMYDGADGRRPNLSKAHVRLLKNFVMEDYEGVADALSRMK